jgi:hypothetical protein
MELRELSPLDLLSPVLKFFSITKEENESMLKYEEGCKSSRTAKD